jgi:hypothetical protein
MGNGAVALLVRGVPTSLLALDAGLEVIVAAARWQAERRGYR